MTVTLLRKSPPVLCAFCRDNINSEPVKCCGACGIAQHIVCLKEHGRCATMNCNPVGAIEPGANANHPIHAFVADNPLEARCEDSDGFYDYQTAFTAANLARVYFSHSQARIDGEECTIAAANTIELEQRFGGEYCHCEHLDMTCDGHPFDQSGPACAWYGTDEGEVCMNVLTEPCGCRNDPDDDWACENEAIEVLQGLEAYPLIGDETHSQVEMALVTGHYSNGDGIWEAIKEMTRHLASEDDDEVSDAFDFAEAHLGPEFTQEFLSIFWDVCHEESIWPNWEGGCVTHPWDQQWNDTSFIDALREAFDIDGLAELYATEDE